MISLTKDKFLSDEELAHLDKLTRGLNNRDEIVIQLALATGARASELLAITKDDLNIVEKSVYIRGLKGSSDRELPLREDLFKALRRLGKQPFDISYSRLHQIWDQYSPNGKKFHSLRHTFALNLYKKHRDIKLVQQALGHKDLRNTMVYVDFQYSIEKLRLAMVV